MILLAHLTRPRASYDPALQRLQLPDDCTPYELAHERAHEAQQRHRTAAWRTMELTRGWPYVERLVRLWVEWEAATLAKHALIRIGRYDRHARADLWAGLRSYGRAIFWP